MKIVVIGCTGLVGSQVVAKLGEHGHDAVAASPDPTLDTMPFRPDEIEPFRQAPNNAINFLT
jgi:uncharacterized protein YbjT (DUF2867 family)